LMYVYFFIGAGIAAWFIFFKLTKVDDAAKGTSFWFKLLLIPGSILLWSFILFKLTTIKK
jgi:hypothetical protein